MAPRSRERPESKLADVAADDELRVVILGGAGRAFCAGHDLREMGPDVDSAGCRRLFYAQLELGVEAAYALANEAMACNAVADDAQRGIAAFTARRK